MQYRYSQHQFSIDHDKIWNMAFSLIQQLLLPRCQLTGGRSSWWSQHLWCCHTDLSDVSILNTEIHKILAEKVQ